MINLQITNSASKKANQPPTAYSFFIPLYQKYLTQGKKLYCVFIDFEKCFDKIDRTYLWQKLLAENVSSRLVQAIKSMYSTVKLCVKYRNSFSQCFSSHIGLKQGDPSSPILFMLFVNDILDHIDSNLNDLFTIDETKLFLILFADDQVVFAKSPQTLQKHYRHWNLLHGMGA